MPECRWSSLYQPKKCLQKPLASWAEPNRSGNSGRYLSVLNWASEYGLSFEQWGREWLLVTPRSASIRATGLELIEEPRSAWMVSWSGSTPCLRTLSASRRSARLNRRGGRLTTRGARDVLIALAVEAHLEEEFTSH